MVKKDKISNVKKMQANVVWLEQEKKQAETRMHTAYMNTMADMFSSMPKFARDADESDWKVLDGGKRMYTEQDIIDMQKRALELYYKDPGARGIIDMMVNFVVGKDATVTPEDNTDKVKDYWKLFIKTNKFDMRFKELVRRSFRDGESFLRFFKPKRITGIKVPLVRFVEPDTINDINNKHTFGIETVKGDVETPLRYFVVNKKNQRTKVIEAKDMVHTKINVDSNVKRGISFLVGISKYIVKYASWLDDRIMLNKIRTMFAMVMKVTGISPTAFAEKFSDVSRDAITGGTAEKRMPKPGSVLVATPGLDYEFKNLNIHAMDTGKDGRLIELQTAKGTGLTEYVVRADSSNSNYSSTMIAESPMVRMFESWQDVFEKPMKYIFEKVIEYGIKVRELPRGTSVECSVNFAGLIHRDTEKETAGYVAQIQAGIVSKRTVTEKFGYNYDEEQKRIQEELKAESEAEFKLRENEGPENEED